MTTPPLRVFLSHTSELSDYPEERSFVAAAKDAVARAGHVAVDMSYFTAADDTSADYCRQRVGECDVYVALVGFRYGSPVADRPDVSYTELEYLAAEEAGLPCLVFMLDGDETLDLPRHALVDSEHGDRQNAFRAAIGSRLAGMVAEPDDVELKLFQALGQLGHGSGPGVRATAMRDDSAVDDGFELAMFEPLPPVGEGPDASDPPRRMWEWAVARGAADAGTSFLKVVLEGAGESTATITGAHARIEDRRPPAPNLFLGSESAGVDDVVRMFFDLDEPGAPARTMTADDGWPEPAGEFFAAKSITLAKGESLTLKVGARSALHDCTWRIEFDIVQNGEQSTLVVGLGDQPFRTVARAGDAPRFGWAWYDVANRFMRLGDDGGYEEFIP